MSHQLWKCGLLQLKEPAMTMTRIDSGIAIFRIHEILVFFQNRRARLPVAVLAWFTVSIY